MRFFPMLLVLAAAAGVPAGAAAQHDRHAGRDAVGYVPLEVLTRPVPLREAIGAVHDPVTTASPEAQAFYEQGMAYLHSYVWIEAARSFHQALRLDPALAMAHAGLSRAYLQLGDLGAASSEVERSRSLAAGASERERRRIELQALRVEAVASREDEAKHRAYKRAIDEAIALDPDDPELWLLRGNAEEPGAWGIGQQGTPASIAFYHMALELEPDHFGAHHYLVHSYERVKRFDRAVEHGEAYARLVPAVSHAQHMYGHDLMKVGRIGDAIRQFALADSLETAYYAAEGIEAELDWHHPHNRAMLALSLQHQGRLREAERLLRYIAALETPEGYGPSFQLRRLKDLPQLLLARGRPEDALAVARELAEEGELALSRALGHAYIGRAELALGRVNEAAAALAAAEAEYDGERGYYADLVRANVYLLRGEMLIRRGERAEGIALLEALAGELREATGPDPWIEGLFHLEAIARIARESGDQDFAERAARELFEHDPAYAGGHYALALAAELRGDEATARRAFAEAARLWSGADPDLPQLRHARRMAGNVQAGR